MTSREKEVLELIKKNPMISYEEIAKKLKISKSTVAVYVASLTSQGEILGKQYVLAQDYAVCIGTNVVDIFGFSSGTKGSRVRMASGGVARNIGENLARLGESVKLLSVVGDDSFGELILKESASAGLDVSEVDVRQKAETSTFLQITGADGNPITTISGRGEGSYPDVDYIKHNEHVINNARIIVTGDLDMHVIGYLHDAFPNKKIYGDMTMVVDERDISQYLKCFYSLQANREEAERITGIKIENEEELVRAADYIIRRGVSRVVITLGDKGAYYKDADGMALRRRTKPLKTVVNATGAGDAFAAGYIHCLLSDKSPVYAVDFAMTCAVLALSSESSINPNLCVPLVEQTMLNYSLD